MQFSPMIEDWFFPFYGTLNLAIAIFRSLKNKSDISHFRLSISNCCYFIVEGTWNLLMKKYCVAKYMKTK